MILTMTVKMTLMLFLFCSGFSHLTFASNHLRLFRLPTTGEKPIEDLLNDCNEEHESFVTLYDEEDMNFASQFAKDHWLGLKRGRNLTWSDGSAVIFSNSSVNVTNRTQMCEAIENGTWKGYNCAARKYFMCYKGTNYTLVKIKKNWCQALQYCRKHYTNLVSISDGIQNGIVTEKGENTSFWIGLLHDEWEWMDKGCSSFRKWAESERNDECTKVEINQVDPRLLYAVQCNNGVHSFCSKGNTRIKVINHTLTWEQAFDYCKANHTGMLWIEDKDDQDAVEQWLNHTDGVPGPFWIGLRQSRVFGFWIWSDRIVSYKNWKNDTQPEMPMSNHCGVISKEDYKWSDEDCLVPQQFLCEEEIVFMNK